MNDSIEKTMKEEEPKASAPEISEEEAEKQSGVLTIFRFILIPLIVVGTVVIMIVLLGNIALKEKSVNDYLYDIRTGSQSERWQAAYQLSTLLANPKKDYAEQARKQLPEIMLIFNKAKGNDPKIRQYLALTMGRLQDPRALPALQESINDEDTQTVIWSVWALGAIGDKAATPQIIEKLESEDAAIRTMSAYVLGAIGDSRAIPPLQAHLEDTSAEVTWNSALALSRLNDPSGSDLMLKMLQRDYLAGFPSMGEDKKEELIINTIKASGNLHDADLQAQIQKLSTSDPNPRVRDAAMKALK